MENIIGACKWEKFVHPQSSQINLASGADLEELRIAAKIATRFTGFVRFLDSGCKVLRSTGMIKLKSFIISVVGVLFMNGAGATTYYFSSSQGNDNYSSGQAQNPTTPWNSISKLNSIMNALLPGDSVLFKRGDLFYGTITITVSGQAGRPITFGAYGPGTTQPILDGRIKLTNWTTAGNNIWVSSDPNLTTMPTALTLDGNLQALGRYPNLDAPNGGYLTISSHPKGDSAQFTCNSINASTNWTNSGIVVRTTHWTLDRRQATQTGTTITVSPALDHEVKDNYGFFFQNHPMTLDRDGEWCYSNGNVSLYLTSDPNLRDVQVANTNYCISAQQPRANITIDGLEFISAKLAAISANGCSNFIVQYCSILNSGTDAIDMKKGNSNSIRNNTIRWTQNNGIVADGNNTLISGNKIVNTAMLTGMAPSGETGYGIATSTGTTVTLNSIDSTGYDGIVFGGDNVHVTGNVVNYFCAVLDDGGGIYTYGIPGTNPVNRVVSGNLIMNGIAAPYGTDSYGRYLPAVGIYMDGITNNVEISNNTIANCAQYGLKILNTSLLVTNNLVHNCSVGLVIYNGQNKQAIIKQNTFVKFDPNQYLAGYFNTINTTDLSSFGMIDSNIYCRPFFELGDDYIDYYVNGINNTPLQNFLSLAEWQGKNGNSIDKNSSVSPPKISLFKQVNNSNMLQNTTFDSNVNGWGKQNDVGNTSNLTWVAGQLDGGSLSFTVAGAGESRIISKLNSPVIAGRMYRLKMSVKPTGTGNVGVQLRLVNSPYTPGSVLHNIPLSGPGRQEVELIIRADSNLANPYLFLNFDQNLSSVYIDNVELVEVSINDPGQYLHFVVNRSFSDSTMIADADYVTPSGVTYSRGASIKIPASSAVVLLVDMNASLLNLVPSKGVLSPSFARGTTSYTVMVGSNTDSIALTPTATFLSTTITINGKSVPSSSISPNFPVNIGSNNINISLAAQNGTTKTYSITVIRPSNDATLSNLLISDGTLSPAFSPAANRYSDSVPTNTTGITLTPTAADSNATITVNGVAVNSGTASPVLPLNFGANTISVVVTAQDGTTTQTYTLTATRVASNNAMLTSLLVSAGTLSPAFNPTVDNYIDSVTTSTAGITLKPTAAEANATVMVNGVAVISGTMSPVIPLNIGSNIIVVSVTAQDGTTIQTYTVNVTRVFTLPATNFTVNSSGDTCPGNIDGSILVTAAANHNYTAILSGNGIVATQSFTTSTTFTKLPLGSYALTITVDGQDGYKYFQTVVIAQPQPLSVTAAVNDATENIDLTFSGGTIYHITLNNNTYTTAQTNFSVPIQPGTNVLKVTTDIACQGIFTRLFNLSPNIALYPMPFDGTLNLTWGSGNIATVSVKIYSATGALVFTGDYENKFAPLQLDLSRMAKGVYGLYLKLNDVQRQFKIIKQ